MQRELPIIFNTPMVQAILNCAKTQTRRICKPQPGLGEVCPVGDFRKGYWGSRVLIQEDPKRYEITKLFKPKYRVGDVLYVRESWNVTDPDEAIDGEITGPRTYYTGVKNGGVEILWRYVYRASSPGKHPVHGRAIWRPSIHMPKAAARIWLEVTSVRAERLQDISEKDAKAEGVELLTPQHLYRNYMNGTEPKEGFSRPTSSFESLWRKTYSGVSWAANPWVWVVEFKVLSTTGHPNDN